MKLHMKRLPWGKWNKTEGEENMNVVRGCEKRIYHVKNPDSDIFDEAYFILRRQEKGKRVSPREIENEAMRIVSNASGTRESRPKVKDRRQIRAFLAGALLSAATICILSLIIWWLV